MKAAHLAVASLLLSSSAFAEEEEEEEENFRVGGEIGLYHNSLGDLSLTGLTEVLDADLTLVDSFALVGQVPFTQIIASGDGDTEARFRFGNPTVIAYYQFRSDLLTARIGGGFGIPAAHVPDEDEEGLASLVAYGVALSMYGLQNPWLWTPESVPLLLPSLRLGIDLGLIEIEGWADVVILIALEGDRDDAEVILPLAAAGIIDLGFIAFGLRLGATFTPTSPEGFDKAQIALSPLIRLRFDLLELEARLTMNLDEPAGFAFEDDGFWGFFIGVHAVF